MFTRGPALLGGAKDDLFSSVVFLLSPQYMPAGTTINDQSQFAATGSQVGGTSSVSSTQPLFGGNTIDFGTMAVSKYLQFPFSNYWLSTHYITIEGWFYFKTVDASFVRYLMETDSSSDRLIWYHRASPGNINYPFGGEPVAALPLNQWLHLCSMRQPGGGTNGRCYVNGVLAGSQSSTPPNSAGTTAIRIGGASGARSIEAYCGGFRFTSGTSAANQRYSLAGFTPPTDPFPIA